MSQWIDTLAAKAHQAIDWLHDLARRGSDRRVRLLDKTGRTRLETSLTTAVVVALVALFFFLPLAVVIAVVAWLLGYRLVQDP